MKQEKLELPKWALERAVAIAFVVGDLFDGERREYLALQLAIAECEGFQRGLERAKESVRKAFDD